MNQALNPYTQQRYVLAKNGQNTDIPPWGLVEHYGWDITEEAVLIRVPKQETHATAINGPQLITGVGYGAVTFQGPAWAKYNAADGIPVNGEVWGVRAGVALRKGINHWRIIGEENGLAMVTRVLDDTERGDIHFGATAQQTLTASWTEMPINFATGNIPRGSNTFTNFAGRIQFYMSAVWNVTALDGLNAEDPDGNPTTNTDSGNTGYSVAHAGSILVTPGTLLTVFRALGRLEGDGDETFLRWRLEVNYGNTQWIPVWDITGGGANLAQADFGGFGISFTREK